MNLELWAAIFFGAAVVLFLMEIFIPSGGILGVMSALSLIGGVVTLFYIDTTLGFLGLVISLIMMPVAFALAIKMFPHTPVGRWLTLREAQTSARDLVYDPARDEKPDELIGAEGEAVTALRPVGICKIDGRRIECLSESGALEPGTRIKVTSVSGIEVKVRAVS